MRSDGNHFNYSPEFIISILTNLCPAMIGGLCPLFYATVEAIFYQVRSINRENIFSLIQATHPADFAETTHMFQQTTGLS